MNKAVFDILGRLKEKGILNKYPFLGADVMLSDVEIKKQMLNPIDKKHIYIYNIARDKDIILGEKYNIIFSLNTPRDYQKVDCEVDYVSLKKNDSISYIPRGYSGCVRLKFKDKSPDEVLRVLKSSDNVQFNPSKNSFVYFTTQEVIDNILEEWNKLQNQ